MPIAADDLKPGLYVTGRFMRESPHLWKWDHLSLPLPFEVVSVSLPYVVLENVKSRVRVAIDVGVYELEQLRPEFVAALYPEHEDRIMKRRKPVSIKEEKRVQEQTHDKDGFLRGETIYRIGPSGGRLL